MDPIEPAFEMSKSVDLLVTGSAGKSSDSSQS
uniref:Uncharacterized protein n=1 Tax=Arundo donax TaxID=35708 RepID=A0A0A8ZDP6_ARUDO